MKNNTDMKNNEPKAVQHGSIEHRLAVINAAMKDELFTPDGHETIDEAFVKAFNAIAEEDVEKDIVVPYFTSHLSVSLPAGAYYEGDGEFWNYDDYKKAEQRKELVHVETLVDMDGQLYIVMMQLKEE